AAVAEENGLGFRSNINRSARISVLWCRRADAFLAPWGAALCKYRWICDTPGYAVTSRWNLEHRHDLRIYHPGADTGTATELLLNPPDTVTDLTPERDEGGFDGRGDFVVSREPVFDAFVALLRRRLAARAT
ncbi:MAG: hypothetical protein INR65_03505, partial [Gluconacetobacter diazotrophicus]|nr:hypothetical protein [Gluconacetobacter diazotrophicus]